MTPFSNLTIAALLLLALFLVGTAVLAFVHLRRKGLPRAVVDEFTTEMVEEGTSSISVHRSGRGPVILLLHGIGANLYCWRSLVNLLNRRYTVIAPDLPGFGQSSILESEDYGLDEQAPRVIALLDRLKVGQALVVGNSMGGNIALWMGLKYPERIRGVAVIAPAASPKLVPPGVQNLLWMSQPLSLLLTRTAMRWAHGRTVSRRELVSIERVEETFRTYGRKTDAVRSFLRATRAIRDPRLPSALADVRPPTLILWGSRDRLVSRAVIDGLEKVLPHAESFVHLGGGHHLQEDEPEWVVEKLTSFFDEILD